MPTMPWIATPMAGGSRAPRIARRTCRSGRTGRFRSCSGDGGTGAGGRPETGNRRQCREFRRGCGEDPRPRMVETDSSRRAGRLAPGRHPIREPVPEREGLQAARAVDHRGRVVSAMRAGRGDTARRSRWKERTPAGSSRAGTKSPAACSAKARARFALMGRARDFTRPDAAKLRGGQVAADTAGRNLPVPPTSKSP